MSSDEWQEGLTLGRQGIVPSSDNNGQVRTEAMAGYLEAQRVLAMEASHAADAESVRRVFNSGYPPVPNSTTDHDSAARSSPGGMENIWAVISIVGLLAGVLGGAAANQYGHEHHWSASMIPWATGGGAIVGALAGATAAGLTLFAALLTVGVIIGGIMMVFKGIWWLVTRLFWPSVIMAGLTAAGWGIMFYACRWMGWCSPYLQYFPSKFAS